MPFTQPSPGLGAYPWGSATMEEVRSWRKLPVTGATSPDAPRAVHDRARALLTARGYFVEEEGPDPGPNPHTGAPPHGDQEGAVQGERDLVLDRAGARGARTALYVLLLLGIVCLGGFFASAAFRYAPTAILLLPGILLLLVAVTIYPNTRAFRSSMVWVTYRGPVGGPTSFEVRTAEVRSANFRDRHSGSRSLKGFDAAVSTDSLRAAIGDALGSTPLA